MNHEGLTKAPILVVLLVAVLFAVANIGIMAGHASMQQQAKAVGSTTVSNSRVLSNVSASDNTSNSNTIIKKYNTIIKKV